MIELVLKTVNALRVPWDIYDTIVVKIINALRVPSDNYDTDCS